MGCIQCTTFCFRSCVLFFRNELAQSTSLGQFKFLGGFVRFRCKEVPVMRSGFGVHKMHHFVLPKLRLILSQRTYPIHFFRPKTKFLGGFARFHCREVPVVRSGFGCIKCTTLCIRSCVLSFRNEHVESTSLGPKLSFWVVSRDAVAGRFKL